MADRPTLAFAMRRNKTEHVFPDALIDRLAQVATIARRLPIAGFDGAEERAILARTEILVTGWGCPPIDADILARAPRLRLIAHAAGTVKNFLADEVFRAGIAVTHAAEANARPVAEFTLAAILFAGKRVFRFRDTYVRDRNRDATGPMLREPLGNYRRTVGLVGASKIGRRVIALLQPFDYRILLFDPFVPAEEARALGVEPVELDALMARSDIVSIHAPALPSTRHMIDRRRLGLMADGATLINTARGSLIDQEAMIAELASGRIDAILDVTEPEIPGPDSPLYSLPNVFLTPHIAGAVGLERTWLGEMIADEVERFVAGQPLRHAIDLPMLERLA